MSSKVILAVMASFLLPAFAWGQAPTDTPQKLNAILCLTSAQAIALASSMASGQTEPMAINLVNKSAGAEVCGRYIGNAVVEIEKTENFRGNLYMLTALRFAEDGRLAWSASWVTPFNGARFERGA